MTIDINIDKVASYPAYTEAKQLGMIESEIIPLCDALFLVGAKPVSTCQGHANAKENFLAELFGYRFSFACWCKPFVMFNASLELASDINLAIQKEKGLIFCWHVTSHFNNHNKLFWTISPLDYRISHLSTWIYKSPKASERMVHSDLKLLAKIIANIRKESEIA